VPVALLASLSTISEINLIDVHLDAYLTSLLMHVLRLVTLSMVSGVFVVVSLT